MGKFRARKVEFLFDYVPDSKFKTGIPVTMRVDFQYATNVSNVKISAPLSISVYMLTRNPVTKKRAAVLLESLDVATREISHYNCIPNFENVKQIAKRAYDRWQLREDVRDTLPINQPASQEHYPEDVTESLGPVSEFGSDYANGDSQ